MSEQSRIRQGVGALLLLTALSPVASAQERTDGQDFNLPFQLNVVDTGPYDPDIATPVVVEGEASTDFVIPYASPARLLGPLLIQDFSEVNDYQEVVILIDGEEVYRSSPGVVSPFMVPNQHDNWHWLYLTGAEGQVNTDALDLSEGVHTLKCRFKGVRPMNSYMSCQFGFSGYPIRLFNFAGATITPYLTFAAPQSTVQFQAFSTLQAGTDPVTGDVFDWQVIAIEEDSTDATIDQTGLLTVRASTSRLQVSVKFQLVPNLSKIKTAFLDLRVGFEVTTDDLGVIANPVPGQPGTFRLAAHPVTPVGYIQWYGPDDQPFFRGQVVDVRPTAPGYYYAAQIDAAAYRFEAYPFGDYRPVFPTGSVYVEPPPAPPPSVPDEADSEKPTTSEELAPEGDCSVMTYNGENRIDRRDLSVKGRGIHFVLWRRYQSRIQYLTPLGHGWDSDLFEKLVVDATTGDAQRVLVGRVDTWRHLGGGHYQAPTSFYGDLRRRTDGTFVLREPDGSKTLFGTDGRLARREDPSGNRMLFEYEGGQLVRVLDPYNHVVTLTYTGERLTRVRDHTGREVVYGYENDCLVSARTPVVVGTSTGDDQPAGRTERYVYTSDRTDPRLARNLAAIVRPEEVASSGVAYYSWTYFEDPTDERLFDRVATQTLGGTNASGVSAGGTWTFAYEPLNAGAPSGDPQLPRSRTTVVDRGGNVREYEFNERAERIVSRQHSRGLRASEPAAYETRSWFNDDGQLVRRVFPAGNELRLAYATGPRAAQANVVEVRMVAGPRGGGADLVTRLEYEPLFQRLVAITDPRGTTSYTPPLGAWSAERYTTRFVLDYQEGSGPVAEAEAWGIDMSGVARGLGDRNGDGRTDQVAGNVVRSTAPSVTLRPESLEAARLGSTTQVVLTETTWNDRGQPTSVCDAEGNVTELTYFPQNDPDGDGAPDSQLPNEASGYLAMVRKDARTSPRRRTATPPLLLESRLGYDPVGHLTSVQDPRGVVTRLEVNALGEVVQLTRGDDVSVAVMTGQLVTGEAPFRYRARHFHDLNGRVTRTQVENRDDATPGVGLWVDREVMYDILDQPVEVRAEIDGTTSAVTKLRYDANENVILVEGSDGQRTAFQYDERDLLFRATRGEGTLAASTIEVDYDLNGNRRRVQDAEDTDGNGEREATFWSYDGFDRMVEVVDALQNQVQIEHDVASQVVRRVVLGHPAGDPIGPSVVFTDARFEHDELGRVFRTHAALLLAGQLPAQRPVTLSDHDGDGFVTTLVEHDALSRAWAVVEDDLQTSRSLFDGASRVVESIDALGNRQVTTHDRNGNPLAVTSVEVAAVPGVASESFTTRYVWDQLGRLARVSDNAGQTAYFTYDSRDQLAQRADAVGAAITDPLGLVPSGINAPGNTTRWTHDGLGRVLTEARDLRVGGVGGGPLDVSNPANPDGQVRLAYVWDRSSRLRAIVDDAGRTTTMAYDLLDRKTTHTYADGSFAQFTFDKDDNVKSIRDPNGSVITRTHDALNRLVQVDVSRAPGVSGTTRETYAHDGLGRVVRMTDDNGGLVPSVVERTFDSLSRLVEERQDGKAISSSYTGDGKRTQVTYPGGRTIGYLHDALDRVQRITDGAGPGASLIAEYGWIGPGHRPLFRRSGNGTALTMLDDLGQADVGYDAVQRVVRLRHVGPSGQAFVDRAHGYDRASNRTFEQRLDDGGLTDRYAYDSTYRVTSSFFDESGPAGGDPASSATRRELVASAYRYDGVGNRVEVTEDRLVTRPPTPGGGKAAIHARERVDMGEQSRVEGDVVVDETRDHGWCRLGHGRHCRGHGHGGHDRGRGHRRGQESSATLDDRAVVKGDVVAERVELKRQARVDGDVETDALRRGQGSVVTGAVSAYASPDPAVRDVERVNSGRTDFTSRLNQTVTLQPGRYDDVKILAGSRLILPGGTYELGSLHLGLGVVVEVRGAVLLRVACGLQLLHGVKVQPAAGLTMADVRWETTDNNVLVGNEVRFFGELAASEARVAVGRDAQIRGAIEAQRVDVGPCTQVFGPPSGPGSPGGVDRVQRQVAYGVNSLNQYTTVGGVARSHDRCGNLLDDGVRRLTWDYRNRLVAVAERATGRLIATYTYDCGSRRIGKTTYTAAGGVDRVTRSFWDGWDLIEEQSATGATEATYVSGVGIDEHLQVARTSASPLGAAVLWCAQDTRGDVVAVTNMSGTVVDRAKFDDFGHQTGGGSQPHGFHGRYRDAETGWVYFRNRFYDPETGRFLTRDAVWDPANVGNPYVLCGNGPHATDPLGLSKASILEGLINWVMKPRTPRRVAGPSNDGFAKPHGSPPHNARIDQAAEGMRTADFVDVRKNQAQVNDVLEVMGKNRPDLSGIQPFTHRRVNIEYDTDPVRGLEHMREVVTRDPQAVSVFIIISDEGAPLGAVKYADGEYTFGRGTKELLENADNRSAARFLSGDRLGMLLAPNAMQAASLPQGTEAGVWKAGMFDVAVVLDPINLTGAVAKGADRSAGIKETPPQLELTAANVAKYMLWDGLKTTGRMMSMGVNPFDPLGLEQGTDTYFDFKEWWSK